MSRSYQASGMASVLCSQRVGITQDRIYLFVLIHSEVISSFLACSTSYISRSWFASPSDKVCCWSYRTRIRRAEYAFPRTLALGFSVNRVAFEPSSRFLLRQITYVTERLARVIIHSQA